MANAIVSLSGSDAVRGNYLPNPSALYDGSGLVQYNVDTAVGSGGSDGAWQTIATISLPSGGLWLLLFQLDTAALASETATSAAISQYTDNTTTDHVTGINVLHMGKAAAAAGSCLVRYVLYTATATTVYGKAIETGAVGDRLTGSLLAWKLREV